MHKRRIVSFSPDLKPNSTAPAVRQLYASLRDAIVSGALAPGLRLPSSRLAARDWGISRGVVTEAYGMLIADDFAFGRRGSGTYVSSSRTRSKPQRLPDDSSEAIERSVSRAAETLRSFPVRHPDVGKLPFVIGRIAHDERTARLLKRIADRYTRFVMDHCNDNRGDSALRSAIATYLTFSRGIRCCAENIFVTCDAQQALDMVTRVLVSPGETAVVEDPSHPSVRLTLTLNSVRALNVPVDEDGIIIERLAGIDPRPRAIFVSPSQQYPTGATLAPARRMELLRFARQSGCWIIEADHHGELRYDRRQIEALQASDSNLVVYVGLFSSTFPPGVRVGYFVVPYALVETFRTARLAVDLFPTLFQQRVIADLLNEGHFPDVVTRLRETYRESRDLLIGLLRERCGEFISVATPAQGIHLIASSTGHWRDDVAFSKFAGKQGVITTPVSPMQSTGTVNKLVLGFSGLTPTAADAGTHSLAKAFVKYYNSSLQLTQPSALNYV